MAVAVPVAVPELIPLSSGAGEASKVVVDELLLRGSDPTVWPGTGAELPSPITARRLSSHDTLGEAS